MILCSAPREDNSMSDIHEDSMAVMRNILQVSVSHLSRLLRLCQTPQAHWAREDFEFFAKAQSFVQDYQNRNGKKEL